MDWKLKDKHFDENKTMFKFDLFIAIERNNNSRIADAKKTNER